MKSRFYAAHANQIAENQDKLDGRSKRDGKKLKLHRKLKLPSIVVHWTKRTKVAQEDEHDNDASGLT